MEHTTDDDNHLRCDGALLALNEARDILHHCLPASKEEMATLVEALRHLNVTIIMLHQFKVGNEQDFGPIVSAVLNGPKVQP